MDLRKYAIILITGLNLSLFAFTGCGYHFRADGEPVGIDIRSIAIPLVTSTSSIRGFESDFTRVIRDEFISHSKVPVVPKSEAHVVLTGRVAGISTRPLTYSTTRQTVADRTITHEITNSRKISIRLDIELTDNETGAIIWQDSFISDEAEYKVDADPLSTGYNQRQAIIRIADLLAKKIYLKTMERF